ncbi:MAG: hypothetical protein LC122_11870 [Chitinophagales bacterium]|nr:hypothetical protein [Chitinophagales bacterium]
MSIKAPHEIKLGIINGYIIDSCTIFQKTEAMEHEFFKVLAKVDNDYIIEIENKNYIYWIFEDGHYHEFNLSKRIYSFMLNKKCLYIKGEAVIEERFGSTSCGHKCINCNEYNEYAEANMPNNKYKCYRCRNY